MIAVFDLNKFSFSLNEEEGSERDLLICQSCSASTDDLNMENSDTVALIIALASKKEVLRLKPGVIIKLTSEGIVNDYKAKESKDSKIFFEFLALVSNYLYESGEKGVGKIKA